MILTPVSRIVGGQPAAQHAWPWQVGLVSRQKTTSTNTTTPFCGGSLVSRAAVVTAAHCEQRVARFLVVVGDHDLATMDQGQRSIEPESWVSHPNYDARCHEISSHYVCNLQSPLQDYRLRLRRHQAAAARHLLRQRGARVSPPAPAAGPRPAQPRGE